MSSAGSARLAGAVVDLSKLQALRASFAAVRGVRSSWRPSRTVLWPPEPIISVFILLAQHSSWSSELEFRWLRLHRLDGRKAHSRPISHLQLLRNGAPALELLGWCCRRH